ncbi:MAG: DNA-3-methyladenine glycosylase [Acidimicrobiales bacterium]
MSFGELPSTADSAVRLLGSVIRCGSTAGRIVETEFYDQTDPASHTFGGPTPRNWPMFESAGHLYVYRSYGIHWCSNVVVGEPGWGSAVLLRAIEPLEGIDLMWSRRPKAKRPTDLCSGPGKLCAALGITGEHSGLDLFARGSAVELDLREPPDLSCVAVGVRVGITRAVDKLWRFALDNPNVSRPRPRGVGP